MDSTLATNPTTESDLHRAWHILSLLLRSGSPLPLLSLSSLYLPFPAPPDYVAHLCSIPDSPIRLTDDSVVAPSMVALRAFQDFVANVCETGVYQRRRKRDELGKEYFPILKKRLIWHISDENEESQWGMISTKGASSGGTKLLLPGGDSIKRATCSLNLSNEQLGRGTNSTDLESCKQSSIFEYSLEHEQIQSLNCQNGFLNVRSSLNIPELVKLQNNKICMPYIEQFMQKSQVQKSVTCRETKTCDTRFEQKTRFNATPCMEVEEQSRDLVVGAENVSHACQANNAEAAEDKTVDNSKTQKALAEITMDSTFNVKTRMNLEEERRVPPEDTDNVSHVHQPNNAHVTEKETIENRKTEKTSVETLGPEGEYAGSAFHNDEMVFVHDANQKNLCIVVIPPKDGDIATARVDEKCSLPKYKPSFYHNKPSETSAKTNFSKRNAPRQEAQCERSGNNRDNISPSGKMQCTRNKSSVSMKQKVKKICEGSMLGKREHDNLKEGREKPTDVALKNQPEPKSLPNFELYTVEEEEGSGGYGTVYRARRKSDGVTLAIKCPHGNADRHHVANELKMLERFGGKNCIIKYEGNFRSEDSGLCLVLEHVQHDRPEILKREIEVSQLVWYGSCMFRALTALHKQGVVHRDVKPGNFLYSRKAKQGFLIDFNLATDLPQKYRTNNKSKVGYNASSSHVPPAHSNALPPANKKFPVNQSMESTGKNIVKGSKPQILHKIQKRNSVGAKIAFSGQGADGSGVTSAKDVTSTRIPSGEKSKGLVVVHTNRKELVTFANQARQSANYEAEVPPASKRKRVSAPRKMDDKNITITPMPLLIKDESMLITITPMPLFSNGVEVSGSGRMKDEGERKQYREGQCVGTKGFRAPEVLLRSAHQGPKIDVWSAGVTLLYLMIGRVPFNGDPGQNIKDIANLRGSEDLWEVAKLHNRVSSFPQELHDIRFLPSVKLRDWCKQNTRRPEFFKEMPMSLFDLVDKCLTVNPRLRISAEEAFKHEFFSKRCPQRKHLNSDP